MEHSEDLLLKQNLLIASWWSMIEVTELAVKDGTVIHYGEKEEMADIHLEADKDTLSGLGDRIQ